MFHWYPIKQLMRNLTGLNVEKRAVFELINFFEHEINRVILQSKVELKRINELKGIQGVYQKNRIDAECIRAAIKHIYGDSYSPSLLYGGGDRKPDKKNVLGEV